MCWFTARICFVEIPSISPIMAANIPLPSPLRLAAGVALMVMLTAAVARRWSEPPLGEVTRGIGDWRRDPRRCYHERRGLVLLLGGAALANYIVWWCAANMGFWQWWWSWFIDVSQWVSVFCSLSLPTSFLSLVLVLLAVQVAFFRRPASEDAVAPRAAAADAFAILDRLALADDDRRLAACPL